MLSAAEIKRYNRHLILPEIGEEGQLKLKQAKVLVIGAGGLGCPVLQYLAAAGIGTIGIIDFDIVDESNLQRQILYSTEDVGKYKASVAKEKLLKQNPFIKITDYCKRITSLNALELFSQYDIIVDGSDNFETRYLVNDACVIANKPLVFASVFKFEGQISVFNYKNGPTYRCLYPEPPAAGDMPNCSETGVLGLLAGICGTMQANEVIKIITHAGEVMSGKLLQFDTLDMQFQLFKIETNEANKKIDRLIDYEFFCQTAEEISAEELKRKITAKESFQLVDVREQAEFDEKNIGGMLIPLALLANRAGILDKNAETIVHCASGMRGKKAVGILKEKGFVNVRNLRNGLKDF